MAGSRQLDPDATVATRLARTRGIQTQGDIDERQRDFMRVADVGDDPNEDLRGPVNVDGDLTVRGWFFVLLDNDGDNIRFGPTYDPSDPLATVNGNAFTLTRDGAGNMTLHGEGNPSSFAWFDLSDTGGFVARQGLISLENVAGTETVRFEGNSGDGEIAGDLTVGGEIVGTPSQKSDADRWLAGYHSDPGANTLSAVGMPAPTTAGTLTNTTVTDGPLLTFATTNVLNNVARVQTAANWQTRWGIDAAFKIRTGTDVTNLLYHVGLYASDPSGSGTPNIEYVGFRFDTGFPDTTWLCRSCAGAGVTTTVNSGVTVAANTSYTLRIVSATGSSFDFYINGALVGTIATNIPATSTPLASHILVKTLAAEINNLRVHHVKVLSR